MRTGPEEVTLRAVLLDWDGTLTRFLSRGHSAYLEMFQELGIGWAWPNSRDTTARWAPRLSRGRPPAEPLGAADRLWGRFYQRQKSCAIARGAAGAARTQPPLSR